ncbi:MAG: hypothetical protein ABL964_15655 [Steroidobacteraceae bacterium]
MPGIAPPAEDAPLGSEVDADVPAEPDDCEALPEDRLDELVLLLLLLGRLPEPLEVDDEEDEGEEEGDDEPDDGDPPEDGIPLDELLDEDEVAQPAVTSNNPTAAAAAARCSCAATTVVTLSMGPAPSGTPTSRL